MENLRIGITGSPGTGKKSIGRELAQLTGLELLSINKIAIDSHAVRKRNGEFEVDLQKLRLKIPMGTITIGHLLPLAVPDSMLDFVAILRCSPRILEKRYIKRGYSDQKILENLEAEFLDLISYSALKTYGKGKVAEFDTSKTKHPRTVARHILETIQGKRPKLFGYVNWAEKSSERRWILLKVAI